MKSSLYYITFILFMFASSAYGQKEQSKNEQIEAKRNRILNKLSTSNEQNKNMVLAKPISGARYEKLKSKLQAPLNKKNISIKGKPVSEKTYNRISKLIRVKSNKKE